MQVLSGVVLKRGLKLAYITGRLACLGDCDKDLIALYAGSRIHIWETDESQELRQ